MYASVYQTESKICKLSTQSARERSTPRPTDEWTMQINYITST
jgi:hypothetical protein